MSGTAKSVLIGGLIALVAVAGLIALLAAGVVTLPTFDSQPSGVLVIGLAPDADGAETAAVAVMLAAGDSPALLPDVHAATTVPGTSAGSARDAYPFGGGDSVVAALAPQLGEASVEWVVLPADTWSELVDAGGGITLDVPEGVSVYHDGELILLDSGRVVLTGDEAVALASATEYMSTSDKARSTRALQSALADIAAAEDLAALVGSGRAQSSLSAEALSRLLVVR